MTAPEEKKKTIIIRHEPASHAARSAPSLAPNIIHELQYKTIVGEPLVDLSDKEVH